MRQKEQKLWDNFRRHATGSGLWLQRVENLVEDGMPDVYGANFTGDFWVELKATERHPARPTTPLLGKKDGLNPDQENWHRKANGKFGIASYILVKTYMGTFLISGAYADFINEFTFDELLTAACADNWKDIIEKLGGEHK